MLFYGTSIILFYFSVFVTWTHCVVSFWSEEVLLSTSSWEIEFNSKFINFEHVKQKSSHFINYHLRYEWKEHLKTLWLREARKEFEVVYKTKKPKELTYWYRKSLSFGFQLFIAFLVLFINVKFNTGRRNSNLDNLHFRTIESFYRGNLKKRKLNIRSIREIVCKWFVYFNSSFDWWLLLDNGTLFVIVAGHMAGHGLLNFTSQLYGL